jgi:acetyl esterase/lipase
MPKDFSAIPLRPANQVVESNGLAVPRIEEYPHAGTGAARPAVLVLPGGGYHGRADHEGRAIAEAFQERGFHAFVLHYRVAPNRYPESYLDTVAAMQHLRANAAAYNLRPDAIAICGFSAGGHLAGSLGVFADKAYPGVPDGTDLADSRPDAMILCYPVISFGTYGHLGSAENLLGKNPPDSLRATLSLETQVSAATPPTFLWHTSDDGAVPVENSLLLADALRKNAVPFELHVFPKGAHGLGLAPGQPRIAQWPDLAAAWLSETFGKG